MKRIKIFLRLKVEEIWKVLSAVIVAIGVILSMFLVASLFVGTIAFLIDLASGTNIQLPEVIATVVTVPILSCFLSIIIKRWLQSNWEKAGEIVREEK